VRITVETAREGYLYVVDQERFGNGKQGEPYLIFPAATIRGGDNHVTAGQIVEIPAQDDDPPFFNMRRSRPDHIGEQLTLVIAPAPLRDILPKESGQRLSPEQYAPWEKASYEETGIAEMTGNPALNWSKEEKHAGLDPAAALTGNAPLPQTLFYSPEASAQGPTIVKLSLNYAPPGRPRRQ
jgi:hypothetical protein